MPPKKVAVKNTSFARQFDPEYLAARKDIAPAFLHCALGNIQAVGQCLAKDAHDVNEKNRDGNDLLLVAVANQHIQLVKFLLELRADTGHRNHAGMDALDYATMDGPRRPISKAILQQCDYVVPDALDGPFWQQSERALLNLREASTRCVKTSLIGRTPNFAELNKEDEDYRNDWLKSLLFIADTVRKGVLLLNHEIGYLERDAMLNGSLEVPMERRYIYHLDEAKVISFQKALSRKDVYGDSMELRVLQACKQGDSLAVQGLLRAKASPNLEDVYGSTALMCASKTGNFAITKCLLLSKAKVDAANKDGFTPLLLASVGNHADVARLLLRAKANPFAKTYRGNSVVSFVKHEGFTDILDIIYQEQDALAERRAASSSQSSGRFRPASRGGASASAGAGAGAGAGGGGGLLKGLFSAGFS